MTTTAAAASRLGGPLGGRAGRAGRAPGSAAQAVRPDCSRRLASLEPVRALLIVNPHATSTTRLRRDVIARALASAVELEIVETRYRGHATSLAADARARGLRAGAHPRRRRDRQRGGQRPAAARRRTARPALPALARAARRQRQRVRPGPGPAARPGGRDRAGPGGAWPRAGPAASAWAWPTTGTSPSTPGWASTPRWCGRSRARAHGRSVSPALYMRMALRQFYRLTDRRHPAITLERPGARPGAVFWCTVSNTAPWTYLGRRPVHTNPQASFDAGLDVFGLRSLRTARHAQHPAPDAVRAADRPPARPGP